MKQSSRGAIRKAPNAVSWVYGIYNLSQSSSKKYIDSAGLIKAWILDLVYFICLHICSEYVLGKTFEK